MTHGGDRPRALAGLVSDAAEELYARLCGTGILPIGGQGGDVAGVDPDSPAAAELLEAGVVFRTGEGDGWMRPVTPATALRLLLERRQRELGEMQRRIIDGWDRLTAQLPATVPAGSGGSSNASGVRLLTDTGEISTLVAELWHMPALRLRATETGDFPTQPTEKRLLTPPAAAIRNGVRFQMIYQAAYRSTPWGAQIIEDSVRAGEEARLRLNVSTKMVHVDDSIALVAADRAGRTALLIRTPELLTLIAEWFDALWSDPATVVVGGGESAKELTDPQRRVLEMLVTGLSDEAIARQQKVSVRTVRRHVNAIYQELGVSSRFAAGVAAAKRGWL